jgi:hypothetical protein
MGADPFTTALLQMGLPGIVIAGLGMAVRALWNKYSDAMEKRIVEGRESVKAIEANTDALDTLRAVLEARSKNG